MSKIRKFVYGDILNPPIVVSFSNTLGSIADSFVAVNYNVFTDQVEPTLGFYIKNTSTVIGSYFYLKFQDASHGSSDGFKLDIGEELFVECLTLSKIQVKRAPNTIITFRVIGS
jgi:hypothetical protein